MFKASIRNEKMGLTGLLNVWWLYPRDTPLGDLCDSTPHLRRLWASCGLCSSARLCVAEKLIASSAMVGVLCSLSCYDDMDNAHKDFNPGTNAASAPVSRRDCLLKTWPACHPWPRRHAHNIPIVRGRLTSFSRATVLQLMTAHPANG